MVGVVYFGVAKLGLYFSSGNDIVSAVWPPSGVALTAVFMFGYRVVPGIAVGALVANATGDSSLSVAAGIALGNAVSSSAAAFMLDRSGFDPNLRRIRDVVSLTLLGSAASTAINATIGVADLWAHGLVSADDLWSFWRVWWLGDLTGVLLCAPPLMLLLAPGPRQPMAIKRLAEGSVLLGLLAAATILVMDRDVSLAYPVFPLLVLSAMRFRQPGAVLAALIVSVVGVYFTANGEGPFVGGSPAVELLRAQLFVAIAAMTALMVAAMRTEWERAEDAIARLASSERDLAEAQRLARIGSWSWEIHPGLIVWSEELFRIFGLPPAETGPTTAEYLQLIHEDDRENLADTIRKAATTTRPFHLEHRIVRPDGEVRVLDCHGRVSCDADGNPKTVLGTAQDVTERRQAEDRLSYLAMHDPLTGLANRTLFLDRLDKALERAERSRDLVAVLFCDIDDFKNVNDRLGHEVGDQLLSALPSRLRAAVRPGDTVARFGGDEFVILCEPPIDEDQAVSMTQSLGRAFSEPITAAGLVHRLTASIGIVLADPGSTTAGETLRDADAAMYRAKAKGRGRFSVFDDHLRQGLMARIRLESDLREAVSEDQLELRYQPYYSIATGRPISAEALLRWRHPERGILEPDEFIGVAERYGLIEELGSWALRQACADAAAWTAADGDHPPVGVSVNISAKQASDANLPSLVETALAESGLAPERLSIEITESALLDQGPVPIENMARLRDLGVQLVLDDFGTGYSSLSYLKRISFDVLKIDQGFIDGLARSEEDTAIVEAIISMCAKLGIEVVAEGVETAEQLDWLRARDCQYAQGFLLTPPLTPPELRRQLGVS